MTVMLGSQWRSSRPHPRGEKGYILFELVIALTIFSLAVLGLARSLDASIEVSNILHRDHAVQVGMRSFIEELRKRPLADMTSSYTDPGTGINYTSKVERLDYPTSRSGSLTDLYDLQVTSSYNVGEEVRTDTISVYVYKAAR